MKSHKPFVNLQNYFLYGDGIYKGDNHYTKTFILYNYIYKRKQEIGRERI